MVRARSLLRLLALISPVLLGSAPAMGALRATDARTPMEAALAAFGGDDPTLKVGPLSKVGLDLALLAEEYRRSQRSPGRAAFRPSNRLLQLVGDRVIVDAVATDNPEALGSDLAALGMEITGSAGRVVSGFLPLGAIGAAAGLGSLAFMEPAVVITHAGLTTSQGDKSMGTDAARSGFGLDGSGVTVGALSGSYNALGGAPADVLSGDLPGPGNPDGFIIPVQVVADISATFLGDEGRAMLQIVHDCAPGAALAFATATSTAGFVNNIGRLRTVAGARVIVDDVLIVNEPMFEDGLIAQAVDAAAAAGVAYFSAAGNQGHHAYQSAFVAGVTYAAGSIPSAPMAPTFMGGTAHDFDPGPGVDDFQSLTLDPGESIAVGFQWDQPFFSVSGAPGSANDLDIYVLDAAAGQVLAGSVAANTGRNPVEMLGIENPGTAPMSVNLMIVKRSGQSPSLMRYVVFGNARINEFATHSGTLYGHANARGAETVAAAAYFDTPAFGVSPARIEPYSSAGTTPILFTTSGAPTLDPRADKPEITAPDAANTTFFGSDIPQDPDAFPNFTGTSAAAPHAAAVAALLLQADSAATPARIFAAMEQSALDMGPPGRDDDSGFGLIQALGAIRLVSPCTMACPPDLSVPNDPDQCGAFVTYARPPTAGACGALSFVPASGSFFPVGTTTVTRTSAAGTTCSFNVRVMDAQPPSMSVRLKPRKLEPSEDGLRRVRATVSIKDNCPGTSFALTSITSNRPDDRRRHPKHRSDVRDAEFGTPDVEFSLRVGRYDDEEARAYFVTYTATDASGRQTAVVETLRVAREHEGDGKDGDKDDGKDDEADRSRAIALPIAETGRLLTLEQNTPNPVGRRTRIAFTLPREATISLGVYDLAGRSVARLADGRFEAGRRTFDLDVTGLEAGVYLYRLSVQSVDGARTVLTRKLVIAR